MLISAFQNRLRRTLSNTSQNIVAFNNWLIFFLFYKAELFTLKFGCLLFPSKTDTIKKGDN